MKLVGATAYVLCIPLVAGFDHHTCRRRHSDSVVLEVVDDEGYRGFGEGAPRPYVTGETSETVVDHLRQAWPELASRPLPGAVGADLAALAGLVPEPVAGPDLVAASAARSALELAVLDCWLRRHSLGAGALCPPQRPVVVYSGVIGAGAPEAAGRLAGQMRLAGLHHVKVKVGDAHDVARVAVVRQALGAEVLIRLDANGAWSHDQALRALEAMAPSGIQSVEQPLPRGDVAALARLRAASPIPVVADESVVTEADAEELITAAAVDGFNVRISKCGGLHRSWRIAERARAAGLFVQVGGHVGETAILAAAGRHLAAALDEVVAAEGSFGELVLVEDVARDPVRFGHGGAGGVLTGLGLGLEVRRGVLERWAEQVVDLGRAGIDARRPLPPHFVCADGAPGTRSAQKGGPP
ncbi:MAG: enolase [Acidimicrobiia bacterium]|nr:enolase [Acidimicrobiia bacterium]